jgi:hypothetical protein
MEKINSVIGRFRGGRSGPLGVVARSVSDYVNVINHRATHTTERRVSRLPKILYYYLWFNATLFYLYHIKCLSPRKIEFKWLFQPFKIKKFAQTEELLVYFEVPEPTLRAHLKGRKPRSETRANGHKLTELEEEVLAKHLLDTDKRGFSIQPEFLRGMAQILLREHTGDPVATIGVN